MAEQRVQRRLAAILAADMVGYSRLMGVDEEGTLARLQAHIKDTFDPKIAEHRGRTVKTTGDGLLVEFASVVDAVRCAVEIQRAMGGRHADEPEERRIDFRIGINLGDIIVEGDDIYGDGVNVAARVQELAPAGGTCVSGEAHRQVKSKLDVAYEDLGERQVKNIAEPVRVYRVAPAAGEAQVGEPVPGFGGRPAIAVLPFTNMSGDPEQEYFTDGITEDIITGLSLWRSFPVIARNSTFIYKGKAIDVKQVGRELGARYVLEGSVRKAGGRVRVTSQLIDAEAGAHIWAERYDRDLTDIFDLQDEITDQIVARVAPEINLAEAERASRRQPTNLGAWDLFQRGLWHFNRFIKEDNREARALFARAIAADAKLAPPVAWTAVTHIMDLVLGWTEEPAETLSEATNAGKRAIMLDRNDATSHAAMAVCLVLARQPDRGLAEGARAIELNPSLALGHFCYAYALIYVGRSAEAVTEFETARRLSPRDPLSSNYSAVQSLAHVMLREFDAAADCAHIALREDPTNLRALHRLACALGHKGDLESARAAFAESKRLLPNPTVEYFDATHPFTNPDDRDFYLDGLRKAGWEG